MLFNRHDYIDDIRRYWNNNQSSNIGIGFFKRNEDFTITKTFGRSDLGLINHSDGKQYVYELEGFIYSNPPKEVIEEMLKEIVQNMDQVLRSIHFHNWLSKQEIINMPVEEVINLLQQGLDSFNYSEALLLFKRD
jgi:hypothetical protein